MDMEFLSLFYVEFWLCCLMVNKCDFYDYFRIFWDLLDIHFIFGFVHFLRIFKKNVYSVFRCGDIYVKTGLL